MWKTMVGVISLLFLLSVASCTLTDKSSGATLLEPTVATDVVTAVTPPIVATSQPEAIATGTPEAASSKVTVSDQTSAQEFSPETSGDCYQEPNTAVNDFLSFLNSGRFVDAATLYGGDGGYPNRELPPSGATSEERIQLEATSLENFCHGYATCLSHEIVGEGVVSEEGIVFTVRFYEEDGEVLEFERPAVDDEGNSFYEHVGPDFHLRVAQINGCYKVLDVPPITP